MSRHTPRPTASVAGPTRRVVACVAAKPIAAPARPGWLAWLLALWCLAEAGQHIFGAKVYYQLGAAAGSRGRFRELAWRTPVAIGYLALAGGILAERSAARAALRILTAGSAAIGVASYLAPESLASLLDMGRLAQTPRFAVILLALAAWRLRFAGERQRHFDGRLTGRDWIRAPHANPAAKLRLQFARRGDAWRIRRAALLEGPPHPTATAIDAAILHAEVPLDSAEWIDLPPPAAVAQPIPAHSIPAPRSTIDPLACPLALRAGPANAAGPARAASLSRLRDADRDRGWMIEFHDAPLAAPSANAAAQHEESP